jgi:exodeoxyribonuclease V gamma subunit
MNDGAYPRSAQRADFDLIGRTGQSRPGDRSRRDDDRQLMLDALLAARRVLHISWAGRNPRDNSVQPPSVLVAQLRDYLAAGWGTSALAARTTEHALQPFSRHYFEVAAGQRRLSTHALEWRAAHAAPLAARPAEPAAAVHDGNREPSAQALNIAALARFIKNPVRVFFRQRLGVEFPRDEVEARDDESFAISGLPHYQLLDDALSALRSALRAMPDPGDAAQRRSLIERHVRGLQLAGRLPIGAPGRRCAFELQQTLQPMLQSWCALQAAHGPQMPAPALRFEHDGLLLEDRFDGLHRDATGGLVWLQLSPSLLCNAAGSPIQHRLIDAWLRSLVGSACGVTATGTIVSRSAMLRLAPLPHSEAQASLRSLLHGWREGLGAPLPVACLTALQSVGGGQAALTFDGGWETRGEREDPSLARLYPDFAALSADGRFAEWAERLYAPLARWACDCIEVQSFASTAPGLDSDRGVDD